MDKNLPEFVLSLNNMTGEVIAIKRYETGYFKTTYGEQDAQWVREMNARRDIDEATQQAYEVCSMFARWHYYDEVHTSIVNALARKPRPIKEAEINEGTDELNDALDADRKELYPEKKHHYFVKSPEDDTITRTSYRTYTHACVIQITEAGKVGKWWAEFARTETLAHKSAQKWTNSAAKSKGRFTVEVHVVEVSEK